MPTTKQLEKLADLLTSAPQVGIGDQAVTVEDVQRLIADGWDPSDPEQLVAAFVTGHGMEQMEGIYEGDPRPEYRWTIGASGCLYRVPRPIADFIQQQRVEIQDLERKRVAALREHRAELAEVLGTPPPDPTPILPGADAPTL
jgi:hypothetical protein